MMYNYDVFIAKYNYDVFKLRRKWRYAQIMDREKDKKVNKQGLTEEEFLAAYDPSKFERPSVTVDMLIFAMTDEIGGEIEASGETGSEVKESKNNNDDTVENREKGRIASQTYQEPENGGIKAGKGLKLLMIKRGDHPCIGQWALPGGFVNMDESLEEAAQRELKEETNISEAYIEQLYTWGDVGRDPRTRIISVSYIALVDSSALNVAAGDDADDAKWFDVSVELLQEQKFFHKTENKIRSYGKKCNQSDSTFNNELYIGGYTIEQTFKLALTNESESLPAIVKKIKVIDEKNSMWRNKAIRTWLEITEPGGIAFDHAKIILYGVGKIYSEIFEILK
jgi:8-oxo-dGTP diphosphatase